MIFTKRWSYPFSREIFSDGAFAAKVQVLIVYFQQFWVPAATIQYLGCADNQCFWKSGHKLLEKKGLMMM